MLKARQVLGDMEPLEVRVLDALRACHSQLGAGFPLQVYRNALLVELTTQRIAVELEQECLVRYDGHIVGRVRLPIVVERQLLVQLCTCGELTATATFPLASYLQAAGLTLGLLVNLQSAELDIRRVERASLTGAGGGGPA